MYNHPRHRKPNPSRIRGMRLLAFALLVGLVAQGLRAQAPSSPAPTPPAALPPPVSAQPGPTPSSIPSPPPQQVIAAPAAPPRLPFRFTIDPKTPTKELLPATPRIKNPTSPLLTDDLSQVPEVEFEARIKKNPDNNLTRKRIAQQIAKINHVNSTKTDAFIEALRGDRADLNGLPMAMGDACRTRGERSKQFNLAVATVRRAMAQAGGPTVTIFQPTALSSVPVGPGSPPNPTVQALSSRTNPVDEPLSADTFWDQYQAMCLQEERAKPGVDRSLREHITQARIAALMQMLAPTSASVRLGLVKYLSTVSHVDATRAIARLAIFCPEDEIRQAAVDALKVRREKDYTDILLQGLRYPLPAVARRASDVIVKLERTDLVPQLLEALEEADPRAPVTKEIDKKATPVVRELVKINHHRNCLLCHTPGNTANVPAEALTAGVPVPGEPLPSPSLGYESSVPELLVRIDVTYLRQDFSALQAVEDANPWPEMQRFDFLVRTRHPDRGRSQGLHREAEPT